MRKMELVKKITVAMLAAALITDLSLAGGGMPVLAEDEEVVEEVFVDDSEEVIDEYEEEEDIEYEEEEELELEEENKKVYQEPKDVLPKVMRDTIKKEENIK